MDAHSPGLAGMAEQVAHVDSSPEDRKAGEKLGNGSCLSLGVEMLEAPWLQGPVILQSVIGLCLLFLSSLRTAAGNLGLPHCSFPVHQNPNDSRNGVIGQRAGLKL